VCVSTVCSFEREENSVCVRGRECVLRENTRERKRTKCVRENRSEKRVCVGACVLVRACVCVCVCVCVKAEDLRQLCTSAHRNTRRIHKLKR